MKLKRSDLPHILRSDVLMKKGINIVYFHRIRIRQRAEKEGIKGVKPFDINIRTVYAFRSIGVGYK